MEISGDGEKERRREGEGEKEREIAIRIARGTDLSTHPPPTYPIYMSIASPLARVAQRSLHEARVAYGHVHLPER